MVAQGCGGGEKIRSPLTKNVVKTTENFSPYRSGGWCGRKSSSEAEVFAKFAESIAHLKHTIRDMTGVGQPVRFAIQDYTANG